MVAPFDLQVAVMYRIYADISFIETIENINVYAVIVDTVRDGR